MEGISMKKMRYRLKRRTKLLLFMIAVCYFGVILIKQEIKIHQQSASIQSVQVDIEATSEVNQELQEVLEYVQSDEYKEQAARENFGYVKEGEIKFIEED